ncbi:MAG: acetyl-CoA C-acyltransferase, partial [Nitriliruptoraceae bacterium]
ADLVIAGGSESLSHQPLIVSDAVESLARMPRRRDPAAFAESLTQLSIADMLPVLPPVSEPYTGETLAYSAETLMQAFGVSRYDADTYAAQSQQRAAAARKQHLAPRIRPIDTADGTVTDDDLIRGDTTQAILSELAAVFETGGVTSGNASRLTDGGAAVLLARPAFAAEQGLTPQGFIVASHLSAHDPNVGVLLGPAFAIPQVLDAAGMTLSDIDVIEIHEAFAGQVLANLNALASNTFAREQLNRTSPIGVIDPASINAWGGSLSIGHPFGATGARIIMQAVDRLHAEDKQTALVALCIGGARGAALIIQRDVEN